MITYNTIIQDRLNEIDDIEKSYDLILSYGQQIKNIEKIDILPNQKELLSFPLWNTDSEFTPTQSAVIVNTTTPDISYTAWQFKYGYTNEPQTSDFFGIFPHEKRYFFSQSFGYVISATTADVDINHNNILFYYGYGNFYGSGSIQNTISGDAPSEILNSTPSKIIYRSIRNQILENDGKIKLADFTEIDDFFYIKIPRAVYREKIQKQALSLTLKYSNVVLKLTDDTLVNNTVVDNNPIVPIVSGSINNIVTSSISIDGKTYINKAYYGILDTNNGYLILHAKKINDYFAANGAAIPYSTASDASTTYEFRYAGHHVDTIFHSYENLKGFTDLLYSGSIESPFELRGLEEYTYDTFYISVGAYDFNRSTNPTYLTGSNNDSFKEHLKNEDFVYITTIGLYNDTGDLLAIAKLSKPILKKRGDVKLFKINISI